MTNGTGDRKGRPPRRDAPPAMLVALFTMLLWATPPVDTAEAKETLVFAHLFKESSLQHQALLEARRQLLERSGGEIELDIRPNAQVGNQDSRDLDAVKFGQVDMTFVEGPFAARDYPPMGIIAAPYGFRDYAHWQHFVTSPLARELAERYEKASDQVILGYYFMGERHLISRIPIRRIEDLRGLRVRVPNAPIFLQLFRALGAQPVPAPFSQSYDALKNGVVDAAEKTLPTMENGEFYKVAPYVSLTGHIPDGALIVIAAKSLARFTPAQQRMIRDLFAGLADRLSEKIHAKERESLKKLKELGVTFILIDREPFIERLRPMLTGNDYPWSGRLYERLQKIP